MPNYQYSVTPINIHIVDSYQISKHDMYNVLNEIQEENPTIFVWNRTMYSLKCEWITHNFLYRLGLWKSHTKDVDLNIPCDLPDFIYIIIGTLIQLFVK